MDPIQIALTGVLAPAFLAGVMITVPAVFSRRHAAPLREVSAPAWAGLALAAAFGLGFALTLGWPGFLPVDVTQVGPWAAVLAAPLGFLPGFYRAIATGVLGVALGLFLAGPSFDGGALVMQVVWVTATVIAMERGLALMGDVSRGRIGTLATLFFVSGGAAVVLMSDTASLAVTTGALAAGIGALFAASLIAPGLAEVGRAAPVIAMVLGTHLHATRLYANGELGPVLVLTVTPLLVALGSRLVASDRSMRKVVVPLALSLVGIGTAGGLAAVRYFGEEVPDSPTVETDTPEDYGY